ncbi:probable ubiquitin-like-specific protease 2B isoform X3 [Tanacetum coccineum]
MADPNIDISVIKEIPAQHKADVSEPDVNGHAEPEVIVAAASQDDEAVNADSHEDPRLYQRSLSTCFDTPKDDDHCTSELETDDEEVTTVVFSPDHMAYQHKYCADYKVVADLGIGPIRVVKYQGYVINRYMFYTKEQDDKSTLQNSGVTLIASTTELSTVNREEISKNAKKAYYGVIQEIWELHYNSTVIPLFKCKWVDNEKCIDVDEDGFTTVNISTNGYKSEPFMKMVSVQIDDVDGDTESSFPKYFPCFDQSFEEVVYPKGEIDAVSIGKRDVDMLLPDTFVNDTIIDFYIKHGYAISMKMDTPYEL